MSCCRDQVESKHQGYIQFFGYPSWKNIEKEGFNSKQKLEIV